MSPELHHFENILFNYARTGDWKESIKDNGNTNYLTEDIISVIEDCAMYVVDNLCDWDKNNVNKILHL